MAMHRQILLTNDVSVGIILYENNPLKSFVYYEDECVFFSINIGDINIKNKNAGISDTIILESILPKLKEVLESYKNGIENSNINEVFKNHREPDYARQFEKLIEVYDSELFDIFSALELYNYAKEMYSKIDNYPEYQYDLIDIIEYFKQNDDEYITDILNKELSNHIKDDKIIIYRGFNRENHPLGVSFTLEKEIASFFANRFGEGGYINQYEVCIYDVIGYIKKEEEILTRNAKLIKEDI